MRRRSVTGLLRRRHIDAMAPRCTSCSIAGPNPATAMATAPNAICCNEPKSGFVLYQGWSIHEEVPAAGLSAGELVDALRALPRRVKVNNQMHRLSAARS